MPFIKTWKLKRNILAGEKSYMEGSLHIEGKMDKVILQEFEENPRYFEHISTIEEPEADTVTTTKKPLKKLKKKVVKEK